MATDELIHTECGITVRLHSDECEWVWRAETTNMAERGLPDFSIDVDPYLDDPHAEIEFEAIGMAHVLDQVVAAWQQTPIRAGSPIEVEAYEGWNILVDPVSDKPVEHGDFLGVLLRWRLAPAPPPRPIDVTDEMAVSLRLGIIALESRTPDSVTMVGLERDEPIAFGHDQRFGPLTPWVVANARAMLALEEVDGLIARMEQAGIAENPRVNEFALSMVADWSCREAALSSITNVAARLARRITSRADWKEEIRERASELGRSRTWTRNYLGEHLGEFVRNTLVACALQDVMNENLTLSATGAWNTLLAPQEDFPGEAWRCADSTTDVLRGYFGNLDEDGLVRAVVTVEEIDGPPNGGDGELCVVLMGSTLIRKASPPPLVEFVGPELEEVLRQRGGRSYIDQVARLIAGLCQPPPEVELADVERIKLLLTQKIGIRWQE